MEIGCSSSKFSRIGRSYHEGFKAEKEESQIFKALTTTIKASEDCLRRNSTPDDDFLPSVHTQIHFIDPIVVVDGVLYEAYLNENSEMQLSEIGHIPVSFGYISSEYDRSHYLIDVVTLKGLPNLLAIKQKWIKRIRATIGSKMTPKE